MRGDRVGVTIHDGALGDHIRVQGPYTSSIVIDRLYQAVGGLDDFPLGMFNVAGSFKAGDLFVQEDTGGLADDRRGFQQLGYQ